jgi:hypothetical protein
VTVAAPRPAVAAAQAAVLGATASAQVSDLAPSLFNDPAFHRLNDARPLVLTYAEDGRLIGGLGGAVCDGRFESGHSAPFGGFEVTRERESATLVGRLVDAALAELEARGLVDVVVRCPPPAHHGATETVVFSLLARGFQVVDADLNAHLDLRALATPEAYVAALRSPARRALKHAATQPWAFASAEEDADAWDAGYALLEANRGARGRQLSLDRDYVERARRAFPDRVRMGLLHHAGTPVAAAMTYRVRPRVELVVAWGDAGHRLSRSPMNRLAYEIVARALAERVEIVDLGTSTVRGPDGRRQPDDGLLQFKSSVGAALQTRLVLAGKATR